MPSKYIIILLLLGSSFTQNISLITPDFTVPIVFNGFKNSSFYQSNKQMDCGMPQLYIYLDFTHASYLMQTQNVEIQSIEGVWSPIITNSTCSSEFNCIFQIDNNCGDGNQINWIKMSSSVGEFEYFVNCNPQKFYKPFQWGLLLLIMLTTVTITMGSLYSKAWSYDGVGYQITNKAILIFNIFILIFIILAFLFHQTISLIAQIIGTIIGAMGVGFCISEIIWLTHNKNYKKKIFKSIRIIDIISYGIGLLFIPLYWGVNGQWLVNDIMAVCSIIALMKLLKVKSLSIAVNMIISMLFLQILVGVFIHYVLKISYNNYIINLFQNPIMLVIPSITKQIYRQCAWLPISAALFPGLVLSYLRRFDKTRGTYIYLLIGLGSFYFGSICWMIIDLQTIHSLPFAIVSEPITILIVVIHSLRRNEFKTLWRGSFHDEQLNQNSIVILNKETEIINAPTNYAELTDNLRVSFNSSANYEAIRLTQQFSL